MSIFASCGHEIDWEWHSNPASFIAVADVAREGGPAVRHMVVCQPCRIWYEANETILSTETDQITYLHIR
jgi:hypothetical protein